MARPPSACSIFEALSRDLILTVNAGSSSLRLALFDGSEGAPRRIAAQKVAAGPDSPGAEAALEAVLAGQPGAPARKP